MKQITITLGLVLLFATLGVGNASPDIYPGEGYRSIVIDNTWGGTSYTVSFYTPSWAEYWGGHTHYTWYYADLLSVQTVRAGEKKIYTGHRVIHPLNHNQWHGVVAEALDPQGYGDSYWIDP